MKRTVSRDEKITFLRLARSDNVGPVTVKELFARFGSAEAALDNIPRLDKIGGRKNAVTVCSREDVEKEWDEVEKLGGRIINMTEDDYPPLLKEIVDPPPVITVLGDCRLLQKDCFAIVGTRNATANGANMAMRIAADMGRAGYVIVSGLAYGIDSYAHKAALEADAPTVAVLGSGAAVPYPAEHTKLYRNIIEKGAVVSEYALRDEPKKANFPRRNRIISGLSKGVLVVEAGEKSGSMITARYALDQGREVFAVPGFPYDSHYQGPNMLIKDGAILTRNVDDILAEIGGIFSGKELRRTNDVPTVKANGDDMDGLCAKILSVLSASPVVIDELSVLCRAPAADLTAALSRLEFEGKIEKSAGNKIRRIF